MLENRTALIMRGVTSQDRADKTPVFLSVKKAERNIINAPYYLYLYLPSRTGLVFRKEVIKKATDI